MDAISNLLPLITNLVDSPFKPVHLAGPSILHRIVLRLMICSLMEILNLIIICPPANYMALAELFPLQLKLLQYISKDKLW